MCSWDAGFVAPCCIALDHSRSTRATSENFFSGNRLRDFSDRRCQASTWTSSYCRCFAHEDEMNHTGRVTSHPLVLMNKADEKGQSDPPHTCPKPLFIMKAHRVVQLLFSVVLSTLASCSSSSATAKSSSPALEYDVRSAQWKPAGPKPQITVNPKPTPTHSPLTAERAGMQVVRCVVMAAKVPLMGIVALGSACGGGGGQGAVPLHDFDPIDDIDRDIRADR